MQEPLISVSGLSKSYGPLKAVDDLSFSVYSGEVYGFLGQNGAGKSTTIRMLLTLVEPDAGSIRIFGQELKRHRKAILSQVGAIIERPDLYRYLTGFENLSLFARISGMSVSGPRILDQLELVGLKDRAHDKVRTYSQGMKQRLGLAVALVHDPRLIILDEPTNGLDPQGIADVRNLILQLSRNRGKTVLVSSHLLNEVEMIADRMLILDRGRKMVEGSVNVLLDPARTILDLEVDQPEEVYAVLQRGRWRESLVEIRKGKIVLQVSREAIPQLVQDLVKEGASLRSLQPRHSLEDYFLSLTTENRHVDSFTN